jgi:penicillin amidase
VRRALLVVGLILLGIALAASGFGAAVVLRAYPKTSGVLRIPGIREPVEVIRDRWGIPHVYARNAHDLFFVQGFVHAQDRLWQMELHRRAARGELSEIFGERTLATDRFMRTLGLGRAARLEWTLLSESTREALRAYADGVNAFLRTGRLPPEFLLLRFRPRPWTPLDSLAFGKLMAYELGGNWQSELLRAMLVARFGPRIAERLMPSSLPETPVIVPEAGPRARSQPDDGGDLARIFRDARITVPAGWADVGSNNWVVAGSRTDTGKPYLANDPHLRIGFPSIWYEMHLEGGPYRVAGFTFPGVPFVVIGHNDRIAWGMTNANPDVQDLFVERLHPDNPNLYLFRGSWHPIRKVVEGIQVRGRHEPVRLVVRLTHHGPLLNDVVEGLAGFVALRWTALLPSTVAEGVARLNRARSWAEFREALGWFHVPSQNVVYADVDGNIGYQLPGLIPIRKGGDGTLPVPGWTGTYEWVGWVPYDALPHLLNPPRGWIATANNRITPAGYPYLLGMEWAEGLRARRIVQVLTSRDRHTRADMERLQLDVLSLPALEIAPVLARLRTTDPRVRAAQEVLRGWNGVVSVSSRAAAIYEAFLVRAAEFLFRPVLGEDGWSQYARRPFAATAFLLLWRRPQDPWWGPGGRDGAAERILRRALADLEARLGPDPTRWTWGALHRARFTHVLGGLPVLDRMLNLPPLPSPGDGWTVNQARYSLLEPFDQTIVASMRMVIDLGDFDRSVAIHTTGQSGLPFHRHRGDFAPLWVRGEYHPMLWSRSRILEHREATLTLRP